MALTVDTLLDQQGINNHDDFVVAIVTKLYQDDLSLDDYLHKKRTLVVDSIPIQFQQKDDGVHITKFNSQPVDFLFMY